MPHAASLQMELQCPLAHLGRNVVVVCPAFVLTIGRSNLFA